MNDDHIVRWEWEDTSVTAWEVWLDVVETRLGHDLDSNEYEVGYSLDMAYAMWKHGLTPDEATARIIESKRQHREQRTWL